MRIQPDIEFIRSNRYPIAMSPDREAEIHILDTLVETIRTLETEGSPEFHVYYQPYINNNNPDIVIHRPGYGALIIEVKNIDLSQYRLREGGSWEIRVGKNGEWIRKRSPFQQVKTYKDILLDFYCGAWLTKKVENDDYFAYLNTAVYFHGTGNASVEAMTPGKWDRYLTEEGIRQNPEVVRKLLAQAHLLAPTKLDTNDIDEEFAVALDDLERRLQPPERVRSWMEMLDFSDPEFKNIMESRAVRQKVRGFAGTGKTTLLARRAVEAQARTGQRVLVLCFNITMVNFLHDRVNLFRKEKGTPWDCFEIVHYHLFLKQKKNRLGVVEVRCEDRKGRRSVRGVDERRYFEEVEIPESEKYAAIFVDEVQDFEYEWLRLLQDFFLLPNGEFFLAGDEKQNIYDLATDQDKYTRTPVTGGWNELKTVRRCNPVITDLAVDFFREFLATKYPSVSLDLQRLLPDPDCRVRYTREWFKPSDYGEILRRLRAHEQDVTVLSNRCFPLRKIEQELRARFGMNPTLMCETQAEWEREREKHSDKDDFREALREIRKSRKFNFRHGDCVKLATIHSFKGGSQDTIILLLDSPNPLDAVESAVETVEMDTDTAGISHELVYTAITRSRKNLLVYDPEGLYEAFFLPRAG